MRAILLSGGLALVLTLLGTVLAIRVLVAKGYGYPKWQANAYYEAARCFEVLKKTEQALTNYREVLRYEDSDKRPLAEERIKALGG